MGKKKFFLVLIGMLTGIPFILVIVTDLLEPKQPFKQPFVEENKPDKTLIRSKDTSSANDYINQSLKLIHANKFEEAIIAGYNSLEVEPGNSIAYNNIGYAQLLLNNFKEAEKNFKIALKIKPEFELAKNNLFMLRGRKEIAMKALNKKASDFKKKPDFSQYYTLGLEYYNLGMFKESVEANLVALQLNSKSAETYNNICAAYNELHQYEKAIMACNEALKLKPDFMLASNNLAFSKSHR